MKEAKFKNYDDLPLMLSVPDLTEALGISRAGAYELVKSEGFPTLHIGNRILVPKDELVAWIKDNTSRTGCIILRLVNEILLDLRERPRYCLAYQT